jgi:bifunctional DNase/RNase
MTILMKCVVPNCPNPPLIHILKISARKPAGEIDVCGRHSWSYGPFSQDERTLPISERQSRKQPSRFELECIVFFDEFSEAGIYFREVGGKRRFSSKCGHVELTHLYNVINNLQNDRPFIYAAMASTIQALGGKLEEVLVDAMVDRVFHAKLHISHGERMVVIDLRPTDAYILAILFDVPILVAESVLGRIV